MLVLLFIRPPKRTLIDPPKPVFEAPEMHRHTTFGRIKTGRELKLTAWFAAVIADPIHVGRLVLST